MNVLRWRSTGSGLVLLVLTTSSAWAAVPEALSKNEGTLLVTFVSLTCILALLGWTEMRSGRGQAFDLEIDRLAAAAAQKQAKKSGDISALLDESSSESRAPIESRPSEKLMPPPPLGGNLPPPPPPPTPRTSTPPPPPPPPSVEGDSFGARLAAVNDVAKPATKTAPISFGNTAPTPAAADSTGASGGGWADLLQRVRSNDSEPPNPFKSPGVGAIPTTEEESGNKPAAAGGDAWEALLRKTVSTASGESVAPVSAPPSIGLPSGRSSFALGNTGVSSSDPEPGSAPSEEKNDAVPDLMKKIGRTISLDLNKGEASSNPFQKPTQ